MKILSNFQSYRLYFFLHLIEEYFRLMRKRLFTVLFFLLFVPGAKAQYVYIGDQMMVAWLSFYYPNSMSGPYLDTTNTAVINEDTIKITVPNVTSLNGIQYFDNAKVLIISNGIINYIPAFPPSLLEIDIVFNNLVSLPALPNGLIRLKCFENNLTSLPSLPSTLEFLACGNNNLSVLPPLPNSLKQLFCNENYLTSLPALPDSLNIFDCRQNNLTVLPALPANLTEFGCSQNNLSSLPVLPNSLKWLSAAVCNLSVFPVLPNSLQFFGCGGNNLSVLPTLPDSLQVLFCDYNNLTFLPNLPNSLIELYCQYNSLSYLPNLPSGLAVLIATNNLNLTCLPVLPNNLQLLYLGSTNIGCLPNTPFSLNNTDFVSLPKCQPNNSYSCVTTGSISGAAFFDINNDCINTNDISSSATYHLYDTQGNFLQSTSSGSDNNYYFSVLQGDYMVEVDSSFMSNSVSINCPISADHTVFALQDSSYTDLNFGFNCIGSDPGILTILNESIAFPGQVHLVKTIAGDLSNYFGLNCAAGTGGTVQVNVNGPVSYVGVPTSAIVPFISGNSYTFSISDFAATNLHQSIVLKFLTDTTAQAGDSITVTATVISDSLDMDSTNNMLTYIYVVVNSYDPNMKEVNPVDVQPGFEDYFTYTVHFQNLGSAPAFNIRIKDTLDQNLDIRTLRVINASHNYSYNLSNDLLSVYFQNIMLADSASNPEGSKGFVQYQVKPKANLPLGTSIENTAHIFFDFNPAVVTNTTTNNFVEKKVVPYGSNPTYTIHPNPSSGHIVIVNQLIGNEQRNIRIQDLMGKTLINTSLSFKNGVSSLDTDLISGSYFVLLENEAGDFSSYRLVIRK